MATPAAPAGAVLGVASVSGVVVGAVAPGMELSRAMALSVCSRSFVRVKGFGFGFSLGLRLRRFWGC